MAAKFCHTKALSNVGLGVPTILIKKKSQYADAHSLLKHSLTTLRVVYWNNVTYSILIIECVRGKIYVVFHFNHVKTNENFHDDLLMHKFIILLRLFIESINLAKYQLKSISLLNSSSSIQSYSNRIKSN